MKLSYINYILILGVLFLTACREDIELDLKNDEPKLVIDANVNATNGRVEVLLSKSNGFYESVDIHLVNDASITLELPDGSTLDVPFVGQGKYEMSGLTLSSGDELLMTVTENEGKSYTAKTTTPALATLDSVYVSLSTGGFGGDDEDGDNYQLFAYWYDTADQPNYYRLRFFTADEGISDSYNLFNDEGFDGDEMFRPIFSSFNPGEEVEVMLLSLDPQSFDYFNELSSVESQGFNSSTPFNPKSNFDNGALGYLSILQQNSKTVIIPE